MRPDKSKIVLFLIINGKKKKKKKKKKPIRTQITRTKETSRREKLDVQKLFFKIK